jgi:hypothetical protein
MFVILSVISYFYIFVTPMSIVKHSILIIILKGKVLVEFAGNPLHKRIYRKKLVLMYKCFICFPGFRVPD